MRKAIVFNEYIKCQHRLIVNVDEDEEDNELNEAVAKSEYCDHMDDVCNIFEEMLGEKFIVIERDFSEEVDQIEYDNEYYINKSGNRIS